MKYVFESKDGGQKVEKMHHNKYRYQCHIHPFVLKKVAYWDQQ